MSKSFLRQPHFYLPCMLCVLLSTILLFLHFTHFFTFHTITCDVHGEACPDFIQAELNELKGSSVFRETYRQKIAKIQEVLPSFSHATAERVLPNTLHVSFTKVPTAYVLGGGNVALRVVDEVGIVSEIQAASESAGVQSSFPQVIAPESFVDALQVNNQVEPRVHQALLEVLHAQSKYSLTFATIEVKDTEEIDVTLPDQKRVILPTSQTEVALEKLSQVLKTVDFTRVPESITVIDVRFKYPVLKNH